MKCHICTEWEIIAFSAGLLKVKTAAATGAPLPFQTVLILKLNF
jgi:hypothetical protein